MTPKKHHGLLRNKMSQFLPTGYFLKITPSEQLSSDKLSPNKSINTPSNKENCYFADQVFELQPSLKEKTQNFPFSNKD